MRFIEALAGAALLASVAVAQPAPQVPERAARPDSTTSLPAVAGRLEAQNAWVRATPGTDVAAAYLTLRNVSASPVTVIGIECPIAGHAMIHETTVQGGQSRMRPFEQLIVAPGATVKLQPGGLHIMLHDLKQALTVGQSVPLVVKLAGGSTVQVTAAVRPLSAE